MLFWELYSIIIISKVQAHIGKGHFTDMSLTFADYDNAVKVTRNLKENWSNKDSTQLMICSKF